jgi:hypothetical protein
VSALNDAGYKSRIIQDVLIVWYMVINEDPVREEHGSATSRCLIANRCLTAMVLL